MDDVFPMETPDVQRAKSIVLGSPRLSARDALHLAIIARHRIARILSFASGFDALPGVTRLHP